MVHKSRDIETDDGMIHEIVDLTDRILFRPPQVAFVFDGLASKLNATKHEGFKASDQQALAQFGGMIRQMDKDGATLDVCAYAVTVLDVDGVRPTLHRRRVLWRFHTGMGLHTGHNY